MHEIIQTTLSKTPSPLFKTVTVGVTLVVLVALVAWRSFGAAEMGVTLTSNPDLEQGLVGHWTFDGEHMDWSSTTAEVRDRSGQGNNGDAALNPTPTAGVLGQALHFTRILGQRITMVPPPATLEMGTADWTIATWYMPGSQVDGLHMIVNKGANDLTQEGYTFYHDRPNNTLMFYVSDGATRQHFSLTNVSLQSGNWYHIVGVAVRDGGVYFYINGEYAGQDWSSVYPGVDITDATRGFAIGGAIGLTWTFDGSLDDVRIYNRALSAEEVKRLYGLGATTHVAETITTNPTLEDGLVVHWTLDGPDIDWGSSTAEVRDRSGNGYHGNATSSMSSKAASAPGIIGQGLTYTGAGDDSVVADISGSFINSGSATELTFAFWHKRLSTPDTQADFTVFVQSSAAEYIGVESEAPVGVCGSTNTQVTVYADPLVETSHVWCFASDETMSTIGEWHHYAAVVDLSIPNVADRMALYVDGEPVNPIHNVGGSIGSAFSVRPSYTFGHIISDSEGGMRDDVRLFGRALSAEEVKRLYQLGATTRIAETITTNPTLESGLVGHWTFDGDQMDWSSTTAEVRDRSGQGNDGDASVAAPASAVTPGVLGQAGRFNGIDESVTIPSSPSLEPLDAVTASAWVRVNDFSRRQGIVARLSTVHWVLLFSESTNGRFQWHVNSTSTNAYVGASNYPGKWWHVVGTYDRNLGKIRLYVDGVLEDEDDGTDLLSTISDITIGEYYSAGTIYSNMDIDDVRVYNRALSQEEVSRMYEAGR